MYHGCRANFDYCMEITVSCLLPVKCWDINADPMVAHDDLLFSRYNILMFFLGFIWYCHHGYSGIDNVICVCVRGWGESGGGGAPFNKMAWVNNP